MAIFAKLNKETSVVENIIEATQLFIYGLEDFDQWVLCVGQKNRPRIGYTYSAEKNMFIPPKQFESWHLNEDSCLWEAPTPYPDPEVYGLTRWNEEQQQWIKHYSAKEVADGVADSDEEYMAAIGRL